MILKFPESDINYWAQRYSYPRDIDILLSQKKIIQNTGKFTKDQLRVIAQWKSPRSARYIEKNSEKYVNEVSSWSFSAKEERAKIEVLTLLDGVGWPFASVILHFYHREEYPILDFRALWSVGIIDHKLYSFPLWWNYVKYCRQLCERNSIDIRTLDCALWQYSKEKQNIE